MTPTGMLARRLPTARSRGARPPNSRTHTVTPNPSSGPEPFDPRAELEFVRGVRARQEAAVASFENRMRCVPRFMSALNRQRGHTLDEHDLADASQQATVIVLRKLEEFEARVPLEGWLYRLCHFEFLNALRRRARYHRRNRELVEEDTMQQEPDGRNEHDDVHLALDRLGGAEAEVIRMRHFEGLSCADIAARLGVPVNTVKTRYHRGIRRLEQILEASRRREEGEA